MLFGEYQHNIDKKGRVIIPSRLRDGLGEQFMICKGLEENRCLYIYSLDQWEDLTERIQQMPTAKSRTLKRFLYAGAAELECDSQGRVLIPANLREYASLEGAAYIVGASDHAEIWNSDKWLEVSEKTTPEVVAQLMEELDF